MPGDNDSPDRTYRFPFFVSRLLCPSFPSILDEINSSAEVLGQILEFLQAPSPLNPVLSNYFTDLSESLLDRDKALMKTLTQGGYRHLFSHLHNRNLVPFFSKLLIKSSKSKKLESFALEILEMLSNALNSLESCENASKIICFGLPEDFIFMKYKNLFESIFEDWTSSEIITKNKLKVIKIFLEKEKDLKFIDEDSWGTPQTVRVLVKNSENLYVGLDTAKNEEIMTSCKTKITKLGESCLVTLEIWGIMADMRHPSVNSLFKSLKVVEQSLVLFKRHQLSSIFHVCFTNFMINCLNSDLYLETSQLLYQFLVSTFQDPEQSRVEQGFLANCYKSGSILIKTIENYLILQETLASQQGWGEFVSFISSKMTINSNLIEYF